VRIGLSQACLPKRTLLVDSLESRSNGLICSSLGSTNARIIFQKLLIYILPKCVAYLIGANSPIFTDRNPPFAQCHIFFGPPIHTSLRFCGH
ncbi:unnamed protein product, partial [Prunus brigantina]